MILKIFLTILISFFVFSGNAIAATAEDYYGFTPASETVHNYTVTDGTTSVLLRDFIGHEKPLPEGYNTDAQYQIALDAWNLEGGGKWAKLWPYVPMFSREDVKGFVQPVDEPGQNTSPDPIEVAIPHLARTYEVTSALSFILSPYKEDRSAVEPNLASQWINPAPWSVDKFWFDSDENQSGNWDDLGPVCDPQQIVISSSGDLAHDERSNTATFKTVQMNNPFYNPDCVKRVVDPLTGAITLDDSACYIDQAVRFSPTYLKTYTPYLHDIMDRLLTGPYAVFNLFKPYSEVANEELENWPAAANEQEENLAYSFSGGQAEAGLKQPASPAKYYFKYLGTIHCEKEKLMAKLQPFLSGSDYEIDPQCSGEAPANFIPSPGAYASGSCPIPEAGTLLCGSFVTPNDTVCRHGTNQYWSNKLCDQSYCSQYPASKCCQVGVLCRWALPSVDQACWESPYAGSTCYNPQSSCDYYGFAADFSYADRRGNAPVVYPEIEGQSLSWQVVGSIPLRECAGAGAILRANAGNNVYEIYMTHLNQSPSGGQSGQVAGTLYDFPGRGCYGTPHVHLEVKINGSNIRPDNFCQQ